jgi:hypothetical protein
VHRSLVRRLIRKLALALPEHATTNQPNTSIMSYYIKSTTNYQGVQSVPLLRYIHYDINTDETLTEQKIVGTTVVDCHTWRQPGDHAEALYNQSRNDGWVDAPPAEFAAHICNRWREP